MDSESIVIELPPLFHINQSRWKAYMDCPRVYGWPYVEDLVPSRRKVYFEVGTAVHAGMVQAHSNGCTKEAFDGATKLAEEMFKKGMSAARLPGDEAEVQEGLKVIRRLLPAYQRHYSSQKQMWAPLGMELELCVEVGEGTNVYLVGRIDNLVTFMNGIWLADYKTMGKMDMREFMKYEIDVQLTAYLYGGTKQLSLEAMKRGEKPVLIRGAIIDGLVKTDPPQFHRELYRRTIDELREFEIEFCMVAWEIAAKHAMARGDRKSYTLYVEKMFEVGQSNWKIAFPKNTSHCFRYGTCSYRDLCVRDNDVRRMAFHRRTPDYVDQKGEGHAQR